MNRFIIFLSLIIPFCLFAQSNNADNVINKHIENTGGLNNWKNLNTVILKGNIIFSVGESFPIEIYQKRPNLTKTIMIIDSTPIIIGGFDGNKAWVYGFESDKLEEDFSYKTESFEDDLINYKNKGFISSYIGEEKINDRNCFVITLTKNNNKTTYYFDKTNYYLIREENNLETKYYSDFKKVNNLIFPYNTNVTSNDISVYLVLKSILINNELTKKDFSF